MPDYWFNLTACKTHENEDFLRSICVHRKPYFMTYVYPEYRTVYRQYLDLNEKNCKRLFRVSMEELKNKKKLDEFEQAFLDSSEKRNPFGMGLCAMNRICYYIEEQFKGYTAKLKRDTKFNYNTLKYSDVYSDEPLAALVELESIYANTIRPSKRSEGKDSTDRETMKRYFRRKAKQICPNDKQRLNLILDIGYLHDGNKQFCWDCVGDLITQRLKELEECR